MSHSVAELPIASESGNVIYLVKKKYAVKISKIIKQADFIQVCI
jgi:hypothetical protein